MSIKVHPSITKLLQNYADSIDSNGVGLNVYFSELDWCDMFELGQEHNHPPIRVSDFLNMLTTLGIEYAERGCHDSVLKVVMNNIKLHPEWRQVLETGIMPTVDTPNNNTFTVTEEIAAIIASRALYRFDKDLTEFNNMISGLNTDQYQFKYGQVVLVTEAGPGSMESLAGHSGHIGIVIGHSDFERRGNAGNYYRVYRNPQSSYGGLNGNRLSALPDDMEIPEHLKRTPNRFNNELGGYAHLVTIETFK